jgi:hypothetical protein
MPIYDRVCEDGHLVLDLYEKINTEDPICKECGKVLKRALLPGRTANVIPDEIPGGIEIRHGLCNPDGSPKRYYSKSEIAAEAKRRGLTNIVEHRTPPGSDKAPHTVRWI